MAWTVSSDSQQVGLKRGYTTFHATSTDATDLANEIVLDISALTGTPTQVDVTFVSLACQACEAFLEFDRTTDKLILGCPDGQLHTIDSKARLPRGIVDGGSGGTGDIVLTTTGGSNGCSVSGFIVWEVP